MTLKAPLCAMLILCLTACTKPLMQSQVYFLPAPQAQTVAIPQSGAKLLQIKPVQLADFLDKQGLVLQLDDITLNQAKNHLWAEDLRQQINRGLRERLNQQQPDFWAVGPSTPADFRLFIEIDAFHGRYDGVAITSGEWQLKNTKGDVLKLASFRYETKLNERGYPALVRALGQNLDKLGSELNQSLSESDSQL
jgi:hypothetical protein